MQDNAEVKKEEQKFLPEKRRNNVAGHGHDASTTGGVCLWLIQNMLDNM